MGQILPVTHQRPEDDYEYYPPFGLTNWSTGIGDDVDKAKVPVSIDAVLVQFYVTLCEDDGTPKGPGAGESYTVSFRGGSNTLTCKIEDTDTNGYARGLSILEPDDEIYYTVSRSDGAASCYVRISAILWNPDADVGCISGHFGASSVSNQYAGMGRGSDNTFTDWIYAPMSGTLSNLYVRLENAPGTGKSYTYTLYKNGAPTSLTVTVSDADDEGSDIVNSVDFVATDILSVLQDPDSTPASGENSYSMKLTTSSGVSFLSGGARKFGEVNQDYGSVCGVFLEPLATGNHKTACQAMTLTALYAKVENAPGAGDSIIIKIVKETNGVESDTALTVTFGEGETEKSITGQSVAIAKGDTIHAERVRDGTAQGDNWWVGVAVTTDHTGPSITTDSVLKSTAYATITAIGDGDSCSVRGFCYKEATSGDPNIFDDTVVVDGDDDDGEFATGEYSLALPLEAGKLYRVRAFAVNDTAVSYGLTIPAYFSYPSDSMARVSSIRRVYQPGLYRMELGLGDLGFDVEVSEAAIKRIPDEVIEPDDTAKREEIKAVMIKIAQHESELRKAKEQYRNAIAGMSAAPSTVPSDIVSAISKAPTTLELLKEPTPINVLAALSPLAFGKTIYSTAKNVISTIFKGLFG